MIEERYVMQPFANTVEDRTHTLSPCRALSGLTGSA